MGIMESLGFGHPHEEDHSAPVVEAPLPPMETGEAVAAAATTGETTESVEPAHMDMAGAGPATVDLSGMPVHPAKTSGEATHGPDNSEGEAPQAEAVNVTVGGGESSEAESASDVAETTVPVSAGEFTTAVSPADVENDSHAVEVSSDSGADSGTFTQAESETVESADASNDAGDSALDQLAAWQKSDAVGGADNGHEDIPKADEAEAAVAPEVTQTVGDSTTQSEVVEPEEKADDFAAKLEADAADEVAAIDAEVAKAQPEIHAMGGEIAAEDPELPADAEKAEEEPAAVEDAPFPAPPVELELGSTETPAVVEDAEPSQEKTDADPSEIVGGSDVHLDRAEYVVSESDAENTETSADDTEKSEVVDIEAVRENIAKTRKALDELEESLGKAA